MGPTQAVPSRSLTRDAPEGKVSRVSKEERTRHRNYTNFTPDMYPGEYAPIDLPQNTVTPAETHNSDRQPVQWQFEVRIQIIIARRTTNFSLFVSNALRDKFFDSSLGISKRAQTDKRHQQKPWSALIALWPIP
ncbi:hypothetical protein VE03_07540 [Pseudogymnoascus sp. 23342-1-I1]|nr:hypothetical protein VE03_07540 [Pseudogymnoascus sp. 23342-1-I1]